MKPCGVNLVGKPEPGSSFFVDLGNSPVNNRPGTWDVGQPGWIPDWFGNNGRTIMDPLFKTRCVANTNNYGCISNPKLDATINQAEAATSQSQAAALWHKADTIVMGARTSCRLLTARRRSTQAPGCRTRILGDHLRAQHRRARHHQRLAQPEQALTE